jgi:hypothetical protein
MVHRRDAEGAERKFFYEKLCGLCVSAVRYNFIIIYYIPCCMKLRKGET